MLLKIFAQHTFGLQYIRHSDIFCLSEAVRQKINFEKCPNYVFNKIYQQLAFDKV